MKLLKRLRSAPAVALALLVAFAAVTVAAPSQGSRLDEFTKRFAQAMSVNDRDEMAKLVRSYQPEAALRTDVLCSQIARETSEALEKEVDLLNKAWKQALKTKFVEKHYAYLSLMKPVTRRERERLHEVYVVLHGKYHENVAGEKDGPEYERVAGELRAIASAFEQIGDNYFAGEAWMIYGLCFAVEQRGKKDVDNLKVLEGYGKMMEHWDRIGLQHTTYHQIRVVHDQLVAEGWAELIDNPDAAPPGAPQPAAAAMAVELSFEAIKKLDQFERPNYFLDDMYQMWESLYFQGKGSSASFHSLEQGPLLKRSSSSVLEVDFDRDGTGEAEIKLTGKRTVVECDIVDGGAPRKWAFAMATGQQQDKYQGLQVNLQPDDTQMSMYYVSAASMVGTLAEQRLRVIDDNADGIYGSPPRQLGYVGLSQGHYQPDMDSVVFGTSKRALPWSEIMQLGGNWYRLEPVNSGVRLSVTPMDVETGTLKLDFKGPRPSWLIVRGEVALENCFFDLLANGKDAIEVPQGSYSLYVGQISKGKKQQAMKALILPGESTPSWDVEVGAETVVKLGAPFGFSFETQKAADEITVVGASVTIVGSAGERYDRTWNCAPRPAASVRKEGAKRGGKAEKMDAVGDLMEMKDGKQVYTYAHTWRPLDTKLAWKKADPYEVQLVEKKNKLFGKIESEWR